MSLPRATRRTTLRLCGLGLAGVAAGCSAVDEPAATSRPETATHEPPTANTSTRTTTASPATVPMGERVSVDGATVTVSQPRVRKIVYTRDAHPTHHVAPAGDPEAQFLTVEATGAGITERSLVPVIDGTPRRGDVYRIGADDEYRGRIGFRLPIETVQSGAVEWRPSSGQRHRWALPDSQVAALGASPRFTVEAFDPPEELERGEQFSASVTVRNSGNRDGRFLGIAADVGSASVPLAGPFEFPVAAGETVTQDVSGIEAQWDREEMTVVLDWGVDSREKSFTTA